MSLNTSTLKCTYLGQKGYTLLKKELSPQQEHFIKKELMIKPFTAGAPCGGGDQVIFPVYRESASKIYIPRYFGIIIRSICIKGLFWYNFHYRKWCYI